MCVCAASASLGALSVLREFEIDGPSLYFNYDAFTLVPFLKPGYWDRSKCLNLASILRQLDRVLIVFCSYFCKSLRTFCLPSQI